MGPLGIYLIVDHYWEDDDDLDIYTFPGDFQGKQAARKKFDELVANEDFNPEYNTILLYEVYANGSRKLLASA
jgi:hypothetical protein